MHRPLAPVDAVPSTRRPSPRQRRPERLHRVTVAVGGAWASRPRPHRLLRRRCRSNSNAIRILAILGAAGAAGRQSLVRRSSSNSREKAVSVAALAVGAVTGPRRAWNAEAKAAGTPFASAHPSYVSAGGAMAVAEDHSEAAVPLRNLHPAPATTAVVHRKAAVQAPAAAVVVAEDVNQYFSCVVVLPIRPRRVVGAFFWFP
jgi:hypothetical protein